MGKATIESFPCHAWSLKRSVNYIWPVGQTMATSVFVNSIFLECSDTHLFMPCLPAVFTLQWQHWAALPPAKPKIFTVWLVTEISQLTPVLRVGCCLQALYSSRKHFIIEMSRGSFLFWLTSPEIIIISSSWGRGCFKNCLHRAVSAWLLPA